MRAAHPLGMGTVHDVANAVLFLASDEASWITGVSLPLGWVEGFALPSEGFMSAAATETAPVRQESRETETAGPPSSAAATP